MTMRSRQILVAVGLVILAIWVVMTWVGSSASPEPSGGPSPTGAIGSGPFTFGPSDGVASATAVRWSGTWTNTSPDTTTGSLEIEWTQDGSAIQGTLAMDGAACFTTGGIQGTVDGDKVDFGVLGRDQVAFEGTNAGDRVSGTFSLSCDGSQGTWEATRQR